MSPEHPITEEERTYLDHGEKDGDGAKDSFGGHDARESLGEVQGVDGHIQRGEAPTEVCLISTNTSKTSNIEINEPWTGLSARPSRLSLRLRNRLAANVQLIIQMLELDKM